MNNKTTLNTKEKVIGTTALGALLLGSAVGAGNLHNPLGVGLLVTSVMGIGVILGVRIGSKR